MHNPRFVGNAQKSRRGRFAEILIEGKQNSRDSVRLCDQPNNLEDRGCEGEEFGKDSIRQNRHVTSRFFAHGVPKNFAISRSLSLFVSRYTSLERKTLLRTPCRKKEKKRTNFEQSSCGDETMGKMLRSISQRAGTDQEDMVWWKLAESKDWSCSRNGKKGKGEGDE